MSKPEFTLYTWTTPNGFKISIALEELGLSYGVVPINIRQGDQFKPEFLKISPNNKIPAIVDNETGITVFESGAILQYLAEKTGRLLPKAGAERYKVLEWLNWQMGGLGPMFGQFGYFTVFAPEPNPMAIERYTTEVHRLLQVLETQLAQNAYVAGENYSLADISIFPWINTLKTFYKRPDLLENLPFLEAWFEKISMRPAVQKGLLVGALAT
jgi:GSH-dependent disulfide-bond oxidoreductase